MIRKVFKRIRLNFRQSYSDRRASFSYRNYHKHVARVFKRVVPNLKNLKRGTQKFS